jgi:DUF4097 and DUF4098 domain-containing protein YvlB
MASYPPPPSGNYPPPPNANDPREYRRYLRYQARAMRDAARAQRGQMRYQMRGMRRGSILGPIALIAIGTVVLLLQTGRLDHHRFWGWYGHWWPLLLVGAGLVILAEWALDQARPRDPQWPEYRRSIGGGAVILLVFVVITGIAASRGSDHPYQDGWLNGMHIGPDNVDEFFGDKHESDQSLNLNLQAGGSLAVVNPRGDVTISGTSDDNAIHISIHKQVYARSDSDADAKAQQLSPVNSASGSALTLTMPAVDGGRSDLVITLPAAAAISVNANRGDIHVASIQAPVAVTANHGDIELSAITGPTNAHINSRGSSITAHNLDDGINIAGHCDDLTLADVTGAVNIAGDFFGTTHFEHINGAIHFHTSRADFQLARLDGQAEISHDSDISADQALGPLVLNTHDGNVTLDRIAGDVAVTNKNGTIDLTAAPAIGNISLEDRNGDIKATLPEKASFSVQANTTDGDTETDFALPTTDKDDHKSISGAVGSGGPTVRITTVNGDIEIRKGNVQPVPATLPAPPKITLSPPAPPTPPKKHK